MTSPLSSKRPTQFGAPMPKRNGKGGSAMWLVTFVDLVSLLLAFFVLMFSMTNINTPSFQKASSAISFALTDVVRPVVVAPPEPLSLDTARPRKGIDLGYLTRVMEEAMANSDYLRRGSLRRFDDRIVISLPHKLLFGSGSADLEPIGERVLYEAAVTFDTLTNRIDVIGHTDPRPMSGKGRFASNWELSLARAVSVVQGIRRAGYEKPMIARGAASGWFGYLDDRLPLEVRQDLARRVDIVIYAQGDNR